MTREPSVATLRRLAEAVDEHARINDPGGTSPSRYREQLAAYRAEIAPLRTRAEVDAEIVALVRSGSIHERGNYGRLDELRHEPTVPEAEPEPSWVTSARQRCTAGDHAWSMPGEGKRPACIHCFLPKVDWKPSSGPSSADAEEVPSPRPPASPAGAAISMSNARNTTLLACALHVLEGCSEDDPNLSLEDRRALQAMMAVVMAGERDWPDLRKLRVECSGPPGVAAKESRDNAAPEGAALEDPEPCGCEETEALRAQTREQAERLVEFCRLFNAMHDLARQMFDLTQVGP